MRLDKSRDDGEHDQDRGEPRKLIFNAKISAKTLNIRGHATHCRSSYNCATDRARASTPLRHRQVGGCMDGGWIDGCP